MRESGLGCHIKGIFYGAVIYADDIFLLSASRNGLQAMVNICQDYVESRNLQFGTNSEPEKSKTKCIFFSQKIKANFQPRNIMLNGNKLPWVKSVKHLGHLLEQDNSMRSDLAQKRGTFIAKVNSILQEFHFARPDVIVKLMNTYAAGCYGSNLWDIYSNDCEKLYRSFNVAIRQIFKLDRRTHRYFIESVSECIHLKTAIASKFVTFHKKLVASEKLPVRFLARICEHDLRTVLGRTLSRLCLDLKIEDNDLSKLTSSKVKSNMKYFEIPKEEQWREAIVKELIAAKNNELMIPGFSDEERESILVDLCVT